jgi:transcription termination factor NusB
MANVFNATSGGGWKISNTAGSGLIEIDEDGKISINHGGLLVNEEELATKEELTKLSTVVTEYTKTIDNDITPQLAKLDSRLTMVESLVCLRGDTEILMEDGTTKYIKDIQYGDYVKAWDL